MAPRQNTIGRVIGLRAKHNRMSQIHNKTRNYNEKCLKKKMITYRRHHNISILNKQYLYIYTFDI